MGFKTLKVLVEYSTKRIQGKQMRTLVVVRYNSELLLPIRTV